MENNAIKQLNGDELEKLRKEVLDWIEKNERKKNIKVAKFQNTAREVAKKQEPRKNILAESRDAGKKVQKILPQKREKPRSDAFSDKHPMHTFNAAFFNFTKFKKIKNIKIALKIFFIIFGFIIIIGSYSALAIYVFASRDPLVRITSSILPFPAMRTNNNTISYSRYLKSYGAIQGLRDSKLKNIYWLHPNDSVIHNYIRYFVSRNELSQNTMRADNKSIGEEYVRLEKLGGGTDALRQTLKKYNITQDEFKEFAVIPNIMIREAYKKGKTKDSLWAEKYKKIKDVLDRIRSKSISVQAAALEISDNAYGKDGGDSGFIGKGDLEKEVGEILFSSRIGEVSDIIETDQGLYIVQLTDIFPEIEMVRANIIFIKHEASYALFMENIMKDTHYKIFIKK